MNDLNRSPVLPFRQEESWGFMKREDEKAGDEDTERDRRNREKQISPSHIAIPRTTRLNTSRQPAGHQICRARVIWYEPKSDECAHHNPQWLEDRECCEKIEPILVRKSVTFDTIIAETGTAGRYSTVTEQGRVSNLNNWNINEGPH